MELRLKDSHNIVDVDFGKWLSSVIKTKLTSCITKYNLDAWDAYLTESTVVNRLYDKKYKTSDVIIFAANNIICTGKPGEIVIKFNPVKFVPGFDRLLLPTIVKTINYGTLDIKGCSIFTDTLNEISKNIDDYTLYYYGLK